MDINGCHLVSTINADSPDGFSVMLTRNIVTVVPGVDGKPPMETKTPVVRGPILGTVDAIAYAKLWTDAANPPPLPAEVKIVDTASESQAVQNPEPVTNPPVIQPEAEGK